MENKQPEMNPEDSESRLESLRLEQNLPAALITGLITAVVCALIWAAITVATMYQIGYMAVLVGFLVGFVIQKTGKGMDKIFGYAGAILALTGCLLGNFLSVVAFISHGNNLSYFTIFSWMDTGMVIHMMIETFSPMDLLFYGIAIYEGYRFSFRKIN